LSLFEIGQYYPHPDHVDRINRYRINKKIFRGEHAEVFRNVLSKSPYVVNKLNDRQQNLLYISINLAGLICKKSADFLFGEPCSFSAGTDDNSDEQKALERLNNENEMNILNYESSLGNGYRGDSFYKIRWGQRWAGNLVEEFDPFRVFIEAQNAEYVFPETLPTDANTVFCYHIAFPQEVIGTQGQEFILHVESHYPGMIQSRKFRMNPTLTEPNGVAKQFKIYAEIEDTFSEVMTGVPFPLVVHAPNYSTDDSWEGIDDLTEHHGIFDEINMRLSLIAEILDKHSDPAMAVPTGTLGEDENGNPIFHAGRDKIFEYEKGEAEPKYITWNGQLDGAFKELEKLIELLLMLTEIPPVALGKDNSGTSGASGLSIKWRMNSLLAKCNRKRQYFEKALKRVLLIAQLLEHKKAEKVDYEVVTNPRIIFKDGLPDDELEQATIENMRTGGRPTRSQKTAIMRLDDMTEEQAEKEMLRIREEEKAESFVPSSVLGKELVTDA
jgi:hypothetical protein